MLTWLQSHRSLRGARAPRADAALGVTAPMPDQITEMDAELAGQVVRGSILTVAAEGNDATWLPPLWLSW